MKSTEFLKESESAVHSNPIDVVKLDTPLLIRLLEYAREDANTDMDLHNVAENLIKLSQTGQTLTMKDYNKICDLKTKEPTNG